MAKTKALNALPDKDLLELLDDTKQELFNLRFQLVTGQLDNYSSIKQVKKQVARIHTEVRLREIAAAEATEEAN